MPSFSVVITETVIVRYAAITVTAPNKAAAINAADAIRCDGELDDPETETVTDVAYQVELHRPTTGQLTAKSELHVTAAGREAIEATSPPSEE